MYYEQFKLIPKDKSALIEMFPSGTRVVCNYMDDPYPVKPGTRGTVRYIDDAGTIHVDWDDGKHLGLIRGQDEFRKLSPDEIMYERKAEMARSEKKADGPER